MAKCFNCHLCDLVRVLQGCYPPFISLAELTRDIRILCPLSLFKVPGAAKLLSAARSLQDRSRCEFLVGCLDGTEARFLRSATSSVSSFHPSASARSDLGCVTLGSLYLSGEGSHLRCSNNDVGIWMTHMDADMMERVPAACWRQDGLSHPVDHMGDVCLESVSRVSSHGPRNPFLDVGAETNRSSGMHVLPR